MPWLSTAATVTLSSAVKYRVGSWARPTAPLLDTLKIINTKLSHKVHRFIIMYASLQPKVAVTHTGNTSFLQLIFARLTITKPSSVVLNCFLLLVVMVAGYKISPVEGMSIGETEPLLPMEVSRSKVLWQGREYNSEPTSCGNRDSC